MRIAQELADQLLKRCITRQALEQVANGGVSQAVLLCSFYREVQSWTTVHN